MLPPLLFIPMSVPVATVIVMMDIFPKDPRSAWIMFGAGIRKYRLALVTDLAVASVHSAANYKSNSSPYSCSYDC